MSIYAKHSCSRGCCLFLIVIGLFISALIIAHHVAGGESQPRNDPGVHPLPAIHGDGLHSGSSCTEIAPHDFDCTDPATKEKSQSIKHWYVYQKTITATITAYDNQENTGRNARGYYPIVGRSIACPRLLALGTSIEIEHRDFVCDDRTALRFDGRFDIFVATKEEAIEWGKRKEEVTIIYSKPIL